MIWATDEAPPDLDCNDRGHCNPCDCPECEPDGAIPEEWFADPAELEAGRRQDRC